jgi:Protein of unknown function (DUF1566)
MGAFDDEDLTGRTGGRRTSRPRCAPLAAALLVFLTLFCLFAAVAPAGAVTAPGRPTAKTPKGAINATKPTFKWSKAARAAKYEVRVYKGRTLKLKKTGITRLSWKSSKTLPRGVSLTWKVRGRNAGGNGTWSKRLTFKVRAAPNPASKYRVTSSSASPVAGASVTISAQLTDANGNAVSSAGRVVTWTKSSAYGAFAAASSTTNAGGLATVAFTTHTVAGTATTVTGTTGTLTGTSPSITTTAGAASKIAVHAGAAQTAVAGTALTTPPSVIVKDVNNNVVAGVSVTFAVATGGGSATGLAATTNPSGIATVGSWTLGTTAGSNTLTATGAGLSGSPLTFTATGTVGAASKIAVHAGAGQSAVVGTALATAPSVIVKDVNDNAVAGVSVTFAVATGGGSGAGLSTTTNASGIATVGSWTLGTTAGSNTLTATSGSLGGSPLTFSAIGTAGPATDMAVNAGDGQTAVAGTAVTTAPSVIVKDANNNVVAGVSVTFAVATGGGSGTVLAATTNAAGIATPGSWTLGTTAGPNTLTATGAGLSGSPLTFTASGTAGPATKYLVTSSSSSPVAGATVTISAQLADVNGNPVATAGNVVTWTMWYYLFGSFSAASSTTNASGIATVLFTTRTVVGTSVTVTGTTGTLTGTSPVIITRALAIGDSYRGGKIAYVDGTGQHGLIAASVDQSTGMQWYNPTVGWVATGATGEALYTGSANTTTIIAVQGTPTVATYYAAFAARACRDGGYSDWYLPSKDELDQLYVNRYAIGGFGSTYYWSSSEYNALHAWIQRFSDRWQFWENFAKEYPCSVRAVRAF